MKTKLLLGILLTVSAAFAAEKPPVYVWFEPEWFEGVEGGFGYWSGPASFKPTGHWGIAGPGISAEWSTGGESEWNSMGVPPQETKVECHREFIVPRAGKYRVWVRYYDHRNKTEPFTVAIEQGGSKSVTGELGITPVVSPNDEFELYWGFAFGWGSVEGNLKEGPATLSLGINKAGEAWRQLDAVLITDDLNYTPFAREKPPFGYTTTVGVEPKDGLAWRGAFKESQVGAGWKRPKLGGADFTMWVNATSNAKDNWKWWAAQNTDTLTLHDILFEFATPSDIAEPFKKQFGADKNIPVLDWSHYVPGLYLGHTPDLSADKPLAKWLARTKTPFFIMTNYAHGAYDATNGPATYAALTGPLADQFLGYVHGESIGSVGMTGSDKPLGATRREHVDALGRHFVQQQAALWSKTYKTTVPESLWTKGIACLSCDCIAFCHLFMETGAQIVAYEEDSTNVHVPMRIAFERGAARQYGRAWLNYASANFGDSCNYFTQQPIGQRGAGSWFHSKYSITDGVSATWYRKLYYLNYLGGASAIYWEQGLANQWILPGPGTHPIQLSPFGCATEEFQACVDRLPDRGEPYTPIAILLSYGHGYERVNYACRMLGIYTEDKNDLELRELFNVCWYPSGVVEGQPQAPDVQSMPNGKYGNIFDVLVDRPSRAKEMFDYPVVIAAGDAMLQKDTVEEFLKRGGTLVVNVNHLKSLPGMSFGVKPGDKLVVSDQWSPAGGEPRPTIPFQVQPVEVNGAEVIAWAMPNVPLITRTKVGSGALIISWVPHMLGLDERAHPALPWLMNGLTDKLLPVEVRLPNGARPEGEIMYQINKTRDGWVVMLMNNHGVDKTQNGIARVDRSQFVDVILRTSLPVKSAKEFTQPRDLKTEKGKDGTEISVRVQPGDVQVVGLRTR